MIDHKYKKQAGRGGDGWIVRFLIPMTTGSRPAHTPEPSTAIVNRERRIASPTDSSRRHADFGSRPEPGGRGCARSLLAQIRNWSRIEPLKGKMRCRAKLGQNANAALVEVGRAALRQTLGGIRGRCLTSPADRRMICDSDKCVSKRKKKFKIRG